VLRSAKSELSRIFARISQPGDNKGVWKG
jgi:hypothetical protein